MSENWKPVLDYEERYEVSDAGRVRDRKGRLKKPTRNNGGNWVVTLSKGCSNSTKAMLSRLVLEAFAGSAPSERHKAFHLNGDKSDCRAANLVWRTRTIAQPIMEASPDPAAFEVKAPESGTDLATEASKSAEVVDLALEGKLRLLDEPINKPAPVIETQSRPASVPAPKPAPAVDPLTELLHELEPKPDPAESDWFAALWEKAELTRPDCFGEHYHFNRMPAKCAACSFFDRCKPVVLQSLTDRFIANPRRISLKTFAALQRRFGDGLHRLSVYVEEAKRSA